MSCDVGEVTERLENEQSLVTTDIFIPYDVETYCRKVV